MQQVPLPSEVEIHKKNEGMMVSEMSQTHSQSRSNFNYSEGGKRRIEKKDEVEWEKRRWGWGVVTEMREKLYQSDQSSVLLQSPDKAGTAGGETMCIKTSWRSMASFCQLWERQKRMTVRNKKEKTAI